MSQGQPRAGYGWLWPWAMANHGQPLPCLGGILLLIQQHPSGPWFPSLARGTTLAEALARVWVTGPFSPLARLLRTQRPNGST